MKIEKLTEDKIRITFDTTDLAEKNMDLQYFMANPIESQNLFLNMLDQAEKEVGFTTKDYKILIEALATSEGKFVVTVTRVFPKLNIVSNNSKKKAKIHRIPKSINNTIFSIFEFNNFDNFYDFCTSLPSNLICKINKKIKVSKLYYCSNKYYLVIDKFDNDITFLSSFYSYILEFGKIISDSGTYQKIISEHGKLYIKSQAITKCHNKFRKINK